MHLHRWLVPFIFTFTFIFSFIFILICNPLILIFHQINSNIYQFSLVFDELIFTLNECIFIFILIVIFIFNSLIFIFYQFNWIGYQFILSCDEIIFIFILDRFTFFVNKLTIVRFLLYTTLSRFIIIFEVHSVSNSFLQCLRAWHNESTIVFISFSSLRLLSRSLSSQDICLPRCPRSPRRTLATQMIDPRNQRLRLSTASLISWLNNKSLASRLFSYFVSSFSFFSSDFRTF